MGENLAALLARGCGVLGVVLSSDQQQRCLDFLALLSKWNRAYNLVGPADDATLLARHILDSLALQPHLQGQRLLDVGSGAGLPGIPLAIANPNMTITLCEPREKRVLFCQQVIATLKLDNVIMEQKRIENYHPEDLYDVITCRAFTSLADFLTLSQHCLADGGVVIAMKGAKLTEELTDIPNTFSLRQTAKYTLPAGEGSRTLAILSKT